MKNIKDFFHNTNDFLLAVVIVLIAAGLIVWRINVILKYPSTVAHRSEQQTEQKADEKKAASSLKAGSAFKNGALKKSVSVTLGEGGGESAVQELIDKKLFDDYAQFTAALEAAGSSAGNVTGGDYTFEKGTSVEDVIKTLVS